MARFSKLIAVAASAVVLADASTARQQRRQVEVSSLPPNSLAQAGLAVTDAATMADATASAEAVADAAEREAEGDVQDAPHMVPAAAAADAPVAAQKEDQDDDDADIDDEEVEHSDTKAQVAMVVSPNGPGVFGPKAETGGATASGPRVDVTPPAPPPTPAPKPAVAGQIVESLTPEGKIRKAREALQENIRSQAEVAMDIAQFSGEAAAIAFDSNVDNETAHVANETQAKALAGLLGTMRKEMRKFASPFYLEHLISEQKLLKAAEIQLQANLDAALGRTVSTGNGTMLESKLNGTGEGQALRSKMKVTVAGKPVQSLAAPRKIAAAVAVTAVAVLACLA